ncbi:hypothetical protein Golob_000675, partial [Gossypium lobatum]|nr:hypothetical protein [Gossypium lobatum]
VEQVKRGLRDEECCTVCGNALEDVIHAIKDYSVAKGVYWALQYSSSHKSSNSMRQNIRMSATKAGTWVCLNSDGAVKLDTGLVAAEWVLRGHHRGWILGFNRSLGYCSVFNAELWGVLDGLMILKSRKYDRVLIRIDSQKAL